jgi:1,4-alpha-glucan branching enzyme
MVHAELPRRADHRRGIHRLADGVAPGLLGGLGFSMKWNMGWMNDTLATCTMRPGPPRYHHNDSPSASSTPTGKLRPALLARRGRARQGSLLGKMPGDAWQRFANLRLLLAYQCDVARQEAAFMGNEFGQGREWSSKGELDWGLLQTSWHEGVQRLASAT